MEGTTPALSNEQARALLKSLPENILKGIRDRAILSTLVFHGIRREELCMLTVRDFERREGMMHFRIESKGDKVRYVPVALHTQPLMHEYLLSAAHGEDLAGPLFRLVSNNTTHQRRKALSAGAVYQEIVKRCGTAVGITGDVHGFCVHALRAAMATSAMVQHADIAKVQAWLGHANISTTRICHKWKSQPEESPTFEVEY